MKSAKVDEAVGLAATEYMLLNYPLGLLCQSPHSLIFLTKEEAGYLAFPVVLTSRGYGVVGQVGVIVVDLQSKQVVASTPPDQVLAASERLTEQLGDKLEEAFQRAREKG